MKKYDILLKAIDSEDGSTLFDITMHSDDIINMKILHDVDILEDMVQYQLNSLPNEYKITSEEINKRISEIKNQ